MLPLSLSRLQRLLVPRTGPCLTVYMPAPGSPDPRDGRGMADSDALLARIEQRVSELHEPAVASGLLAPVASFLKNPSRASRGRSVALFSSPRLRGWYPIQEAVPTRVVVADSFHVKPLLDLIAPWGTWYLLDVSLPRATLLRGRGRALERMRVFEFSGLGYRSHGFRARRALWWAESLIEAKDAPVFVSSHEPVRSLLLAEPSPLARVNLGRYLQASRATDAGLLEDVWDDVRPWWERTRRQALGDLVRARALGLASSDLESLVDDAVNGRLERLALSRDGLLAGRIAWRGGRYVVNADARPPSDARPSSYDRPSFDSHPAVGPRPAVEAPYGEAVDCVFDDIAERALVHGTDVYVCSENELPLGVEAIGLPKRAGREALLA